MHNTKQVILLVIDIESLKLSLAVAPFCSFWFVKISQVFSLTKKYEHLNEVKECFNCITFIFHVLFNTLTTDFFPALDGIFSRMC